MDKLLQPEKTVLETILAWSQDKPNWQRDALRRIVAQGKLDDTDITDLIELCRIQRDYDGKLAFIPFAENHLPANPKGHSSISLVSISNVANANNLAPNQTFEFEPNGINIIYGDNAVGKSGYFRILKRACSARHKEEIHPNIYKKEKPLAKASAVFTYHMGTTMCPPETWHDGSQTHPILSAIAVFDNHCADAHIADSNEVTFRPFGLDIPDELARVCKIIKDTLSLELDNLKKEQSLFFKTPQWKAHTKIGKLLSSLNKDSNFQDIANFSILTPEENIRYERLKQDLSKDIIKSSSEMRLKADNFKFLCTILLNIEQQSSDDVLAHIIEFSEDAKEKRKAAALAANKIFSSGGLKGIGGGTWRILWDAARDYSLQIAYPDQIYPAVQEDLLCLLCQQPLTKEAVIRMQQFEEFIQNDVAMQADQAEQKFTVAFHSLIEMRIDTASIKSYLQELKINNLDIAKKTIRFIASARRRRFYFKKLLQCEQTLTLPPLTYNPLDELKNIEQNIRSYSDELKNSATADKKRLLQSEFEELQDRALLSASIDLIENEIKRLEKINSLNNCIATTVTNSITVLGNSIADDVITPALSNRFKEEIKKLSAERVNVEIARIRGKYGSPQYQIKISGEPNAKLPTILSEGEQTCVAFASFLTELATCTHNSSLVFDDPVCSLAHRWRQKIAERLIEESKIRQVIVFSHDLVFVNDLYDLAERQKCLHKEFTVSRGSTGMGIVTVGLSWKAKSLFDRLDKLDKDLSYAKQLYLSNEEEKYSEIVYRIYDRLRASWERALEDIAFGGIIKRHKDYIETKHLRKVLALNGTDCDVFDSGFKKCCDFVDAHDPSRGRNIATPAPDEIKSDIENLRGWARSLQTRQSRS